MKQNIVKVNRTSEAKRATTIASEIVVTESTKSGT